MTSGQHDTPTAVLLAAIAPHQAPGGPAAFPAVRAAVRAAEDSGFAAAVLCDGTADMPARFEATTLAAALAAVTRHIGLIVRPPSGDLAPYHLARITASLDHLSRGRAGWCSAPAADGSHAAGAAEYIDVVKGLWDSFDDDAFAHDRDSGVYWHLDRVHSLDHNGEHYSVAGPLNVARPPQGHPLTAVTDPALAASADAVFLDTTDLEQARARRERIRRDATEAGRAADQVKVFAPLPAGAGADHVDRWTRQRAVDGFLVPLHRADDPFLTDAVPELRDRGLLAPQPPAGTTLRERLGLSRPAGRYALVG
ncbi:LLM class flavin-dependent oxidoreductase [Streptomyces sp. NPDC001709]